MDTLPAICVNAEGWDTWSNLLGFLMNLNVTVVMDDGTTVDGVLHHCERDRRGRVMLLLGTVDADWNRMVGRTSLYVDLITGLVVH